VHRPRRIGLRPRDPRYGRERRSTRCQVEKSTALKLHGAPQRRARVARADAKCERCGTPADSTSCDDRDFGTPRWQLSFANLHYFTVCEKDRYGLSAAQKVPGLKADTFSSSTRHPDGGRGGIARPLYVSLASYFLPKGTPKVVIPGPPPCLVGTPMPNHAPVSYPCTKPPMLGPFAVCAALHTVWFQIPAGWRPMLQIDPWVKAAECERAIRVVADPERRSVFVSLRRLWIALGNKEAVSHESRQTGQVPMIAQIHAELMSLYKDAMN
jgi:hypothetical protein